MVDKVAFEILNMQTKVIISGIDNYGIYQFRSISATGKTRLCNLLNKYMVAGLPVIGYSYENYIRGDRIFDYIGTGKKLVLIDRYDMYNGEMAADIAELAKECIVLVDCKVTPKIKGAIKFVNIIMEPNCIRVGRLGAL